MSITIHLYYTGKDGAARSFAQEMTSSGLADAVRSQPGCERYAYFFPMDAPETVLLIDRWSDQAALDRHHKSPTMAQIATLREKYHLRLHVERYTDEKQGAAPR